MSASLPSIMGVIGGSGIYQIEGIEVVGEIKVSTPFGDPSDAIIHTRVEGRDLYFLPRHGRGHRYLPSEVPYQANIYAMKSLGVTHLLAVSAVGIMKDGIKPGDMIIPDQIFDRTKGTRPSTFFGGGIAGHVTFAEPFSESFRQIVYQACNGLCENVHLGGTYVCMEGPQFSTRAESRFYRNTLEPAVIGMTALPEAKLAREAEMCYAMLALGTDYDCWKESEEDVSVEAVVATLQANASLAKRIVLKTAQILPESIDDPCLHAAQHAIMTAPELIPAEVKKRLQVLMGKYF